MTDEDIVNAFESAVREKAKRYALDEKNFTLERLHEMRDNYLSIIDSTDEFGASTQAKITLLAIETAIEYRLQNFKNKTESRILGVC